jgi:hypothetical protein
MSELSILTANEHLFTTAEEITVISGRLLLGRVGAEATFDLQFSELEQEFPERFALEADFNEATVTTLTNTLATDYFAGRPLGALNTKEFARAAMGFLFLGAGRPAPKWSPVEQAKAEIRDEICDRFGKVGGFVLDFVSPEKIRLNTDVEGDSMMRLLTLKPVIEALPLQYQNNETGEQFGRESIATGLGGKSKAAAFIQAVDTRLSRVATELDT